MIEKPEKKRFTAVPYRKGQIYRKTSIRTGDKFKFFSYPMPHHKEAHLDLARLLGVYDSELKKCEEFGSTNRGMFLSGVPPWSSHPRSEMLRAYFYKTSLDSFAILNHGLSVLCGFRSKKDYFRYALKFGETSPVFYWYAKDQFWVFIDEKDPIPFVQCDPLDWNKNDPQAGWL